MIPKTYNLNIDATQRVFDGVVEILVAIKNKTGITGYFGLVDDLLSIIKNAGTAAEKGIKFNPLERQELINDNVDTALAKFGVLEGQSKYGIDTTLNLLSMLSGLIKLGITAGKDGYDLKDLIHIPEFFKVVLWVWIRKNEMANELGDIQRNELVEILSFLNEIIYINFNI